MIELKGIHKVYRKGSLEVRALRGVSLIVQAGEFLVIRGPSGSGKTTLLNLIGLLDEPTQGEVVLLGQRVRDLSDRERSRLRGRTIGFVFQALNLIPQFRAWENVALPLYYAGVKRGERRRKALAALERVGLTSRAMHLPAELSGGEEQRVAIARALVIEPKLVLADEPTGSLDSHTGQEVMEEFVRLNDLGMTLVAATHDPLVVSYAQRTVAIRDGALAQAQPPHEGRS